MRKIHRLVTCLISGGLVYWMTVLTTIGMWCWVPSFVNAIVDDEATTASAMQDRAEDTLYLKERCSQISVALITKNSDYWRTEDLQSQYHILYEMKQLASERKSLITQLLEEAPKELASVLLPRELINIFPEELKSKLECYIICEGIIKERSNNILKEHKNSFTFDLLDSNGTVYTLYFVSSSLLNFSPGDEIQVNGVEISTQRVLVDLRSHSVVKVLSRKPPSMGTLQEGQVRDQTYSTYSTREEKAIVALFNYRDYQVEPMTPNEFSEKVFRLVSDYYYENSFQQLRLIGDVIGWYTLPIDIRKEASGFFVSASEAIKAIDRDVFFPDYSHVIFHAVTPADRPINISTGGRISLTTEDGEITVSLVLSRNGGERVIAHEMGHALNLVHANAIWFPVAAFALFGGKDLEYGDWMDTMGGANLGHFNASFKENLGWFQPANIAVHDREGTSTYVVEPLEVVSSGIQLVKILRDVDSSGNRSWYTVEYRQPIGFDAKVISSSGRTNGSTIHTVTNFPASQGSVIPETYLLDMTPGDGDGYGYSSFQNAVLPVGRTFTDPWNTTITTLGTNPSNLTIKVTIPPDRSPPQIYSADSRPVYQGMSFKKVLNVYGWDNRGIVKFSFYKDGALLHEGSQPTYDFIWDTSLEKDGPHIFMMRAWDVVGNYGSTQGINYVMNSDPKVWIVNPDHLQELEGSIGVIVYGLSNIPLESINVYCDELLIAESRDFIKHPAITPWEMIQVLWDTTQVEQGHHKLRAVARDIHGKESISHEIDIDLVNHTKFPIPLKPGWNLISIPGRQYPFLDLKSLVRGTRVILPIYRWNASGYGYVEATELRPGEGYWVLTLNEQGETLQVPLVPFTEYSIPIVKDHSYMIGGVYGQAWQESQGGVTGVYEYLPYPINEYRAVNQIEPGKGYWVSVGKDSTMRVATSVTPPLAKTNLVIAGKGNPPSFVNVQTPWGTNGYGRLITNRSWQYAMGYHFTSVVNGQVTHLGGYFNGTKIVKLFNRATGTQLASATVTSANEWSYSTIPPVDITAGTTYTVAVYLAGSEGSYRYSLSPLLPRTFGNIRINGSTYIYTGNNPNARPTNLITNTMYGQADIGFVPTQ